jgi:hypothetical protein
MIKIKCIKLLLCLHLITPLGMGLARAFQTFRNPKSYKPYHITPLIQNYWSRVNCHYANVVDSKPYIIAMIKNAKNEVCIHSIVNCAWNVGYTDITHIKGS